VRGSCAGRRQVLQPHLVVLWNVVMLWCGVVKVESRRRCAVFVEAMLVGV
jgi:hypothetical protein